MNQEQINSKIYRNRQIFRAYQVFIETDRQTLESFMGCWIKGMPVDGRL